MLSFKELEKQLLEADEVLSELKQLKAEKEKNKNELLNHKFKEKSDKNTKQDNKNLSKDKNKLQEKEKEKLKTDKQIMQKNSNSTINEINQQNPNKDSNSTRSNDVERIDVKKKISETLEPFENEIKKLLNMNSFGGDVTLKVNKTSDSVEIEKDEKNEKSNSVEKNEKPESEKNSKNSENPDLTENIADTIMSAMKISESNKENAHKEDDIKENSSDNITDKTSENSSEDEDKQISQKEESTEMNNNKIKSNSISKIPDKTRENMKSVKELNEELKLDNKEFKNNFLKDIMIKPENPNEKMKEANDSSFSAIPKTPSINKNNREPRYNKKITNIDLNKSKQEKAKNNSGANSNFSLLEKNSLGSSQRNTSPTTKYFNLNNSANLGDDGTFKLPDGPILDFPFFGMI